VLKAYVNDAIMRLRITTTGPLLIQTGAATVFGADMSPVITYRHGQPQLYFPGSSLKGVFRSHLEKIVNGLQPRVACNPVQTKAHEGPHPLYRRACGQVLEDMKKDGGKKKDLPATQIYDISCPTCRLFGSTSCIGRLSIGDAYLEEDTRPQDQLMEHRDRIAIDRLTGGVSGNAKFDMEVVTEGVSFLTTLSLRNFEIWQLGMLFVLVQDLQDELIALGSGRSRGLGRIKGEIVETDGLVLSSPRQKQGEPANEIWGLGRWLQYQGEGGKYGTQEDDRLKLNEPLPPRLSGVRQVRSLNHEQRKRLSSTCIDIFIQRIQDWQDKGTQTAQGGRR
jgi:CRISPR-associated RAMP protein (TIGR02581 family)